MKISPFFFSKGVTAKLFFSMQTFFVKEKISFYYSFAKDHDSFSMNF